GVEPVLVSSIEETAEAVMNGTADVTILDSILAPSLLKAYPDLQPMFFLPQRGDIAFALQKEWPLRSALNAHIEQLRQGDEFDQILLLHFDPEMVELLIPPSPSQESETDE
ncbi:MAG: amino acid ABC transporter substrate-binding protein, partial [bacterium]|nr:amino acid ABC transporter substrate-binding protein [bacterium]